MIRARSQLHFPGNYALEESLLPSRLTQLLTKLVIVRVGKISRIISERIDVLRVPELFSSRFRILISLLPRRYFPSQRTSAFQIIYNLRAESQMKIEQFSLLPKVVFKNLHRSLQIFFSYFFSPFRHCFIDIRFSLKDCLIRAFCHRVRIYFRGIVFPDD